MRNGEPAPAIQVAHPQLSDKVQWLKAVNRDSQLRPADKLVAMNLALHHHNSKTGRCDPSAAAIADETALSVRHISDALKRLKDTGWISWEARKGGRNAFRLEKMVVRQPESERAPAEPPHPSADRASAPEFIPPTNSSAGLPKHQSADEQSNTLRLNKEGNISDPRSRSEPRRDAERTGASGRSYWQGGAESRSRTIPEDFALTERRFEIAFQAGMPRNRDEVRKQFREFVSYNKARGSRMADWDETWKLWCSKNADKTRPSPRYAPTQMAI